MDTSLLHAFELVSSVPLKVADFVDLGFIKWFIERCDEGDDKSSFYFSLIYEFLYLPLARLFTYKYYLITELFGLLSTVFIPLGSRLIVYYDLLLIAV